MHTLIRDSTNIIASSCGQKKNVISINDKKMFGFKVYEIFNFVCVLLLRVFSKLNRFKKSLIDNSR